MRWLDSTIDSKGMSIEQAPRTGDRQGNLKCCGPQDYKRVGHD